MWYEPACAKKKKSWVPSFCSWHGPTFQFIVYVLWLWVASNIFYISLNINKSNKPYIVGTETRLLLMRGGCGIKRSREGVRSLYNISDQSFFTYKTGSGNVMCQPGWGRMDICLCMAESLCCSPETTTTLLIGYTTIQNKKFKVWKKKKNNWKWGTTN